MIYTILVAHVADPLPPLASLAGLADLNFYQGATRKLPNGPICLGFAYV